MISTEAWRSSIGSFHRCRLQCNQNRVNTDVSNKSVLIHLALMSMLMSAALINTLLIISGVEKNPGPTTGTFRKYNKQIRQILMQYNLNALYLKK